jgi:Helix-turn-helix of DDE superfamily endonuclease
LIVEDVPVQVITAARPEWIYPFTGLQPGQFRKLVRLVDQRGGDAIADGRPGRQWALPLPDRVLLVACYWRTNLTMRQIGPLFGVSHSAVHRVIDTVGPLFALAPVRRRRIDQVSIVDGTLVPTRDHRLAAPSKNYRYSTNCRSPSTPTPAWSSRSVSRSRATVTTPSCTAPVVSTGCSPGDP